MTLPVFIQGMIGRSVRPRFNAITKLTVVALVVIAALGPWLASRTID